MSEESTVEELQEQLRQRNEELEQAKTDAQNAKSKLGEQGNEIGDLRTKLEEAQKMADEARKKVEEKTLTNEPQETKSNNQVEKTTVLTLDELRGNMTAEQKKIADERYQALPDRSDDQNVLTKEVINSDNSIERQFLELAIEAVKPVRDSLFEKPKEPQKLSVAKFTKQIQDVFAQESDKVNLTPPGGGIPSSGSGAPVQQPQARQLKIRGGSILSGLQAIREQEKNQ